MSLSCSSPHLRPSLPTSGTATRRSANRVHLGRGPIGRRRRRHPYKYPVQVERSRRSTGASAERRRSGRPRVFPPRRAQGRGRVPRAGSLGHLRRGRLLRRVSLSGRLPKPDWKALKVDERTSLGRGGGDRGNLGLRGAKGALSVEVGGRCLRCSGPSCRATLRGSRPVGRQAAAEQPFALSWTSTGARHPSPSACATAGSALPGGPQVLGRSRRRSAASRRRFLRCLGRPTTAAVIPNSRRGVAADSERGPSTRPSSAPIFEPGRRLSQRRARDQVRAAVHRDGVLGLLPLRGRSNVAIHPVQYVWSERRWCCSSWLLSLRVAVRAAYAGAAGRAILAISLYSARSSAAQARRPCRRRPAHCHFRRAAAPSIL